MGKSFSPSINIVRDSEREFRYIPTPNTNRIVKQIQTECKAGFRAFTLIGSYGSGKSSFLLALEQSFLKRHAHFDLSKFNYKKAHIVKVIGSYSSIIGAFATELGIDAEQPSAELVLSEIFSRFESQKKDSFVLIVIDELGKFLEYAAKNDPEREIYFLQQLAEFVNREDKELLLLTTIHQGFDSYAYELNRNLRQEWSKVKGRYKELTFNEPVEQLLFLASEHIAQATSFESSKKSINSTLKLFTASKAFKAEYSKEIANKLFPLDIFSANVLTLALQKYGQNERSLFSFLESTDLASLKNFSVTSQVPFYALPQVFDYLVNNFFSFLHSKYNPDSAFWSSVKVSIEQVENGFDADINDYLKIVKTIGLLNNFSSAGAVLDKDFLVHYGKLCLGIADPELLVDELVSRSIIRFRKHSKRFVLTEETEIDIELALIEAGTSVSEITDIPTVLKKYFEFTPVLAKEYSHLNGTARYFKFEITEYPEVMEPEGEIDGFIQLIFNDNLDEGVFLNRGEQADVDANVYVYYRNSKEIKALLFDLEKSVKVLSENQQDRVAKRELESIVVHQKALLNYYILNNLYSGSKDIQWFWNGEKRGVSTKRIFNKLLTNVCRAVYSATPTFKNELVNKHKISTAIHTAKRNYFKGLTNFWDQKDLGIPESKFPPEKMIYRSLLQDNGLQLFRDEHEVIRDLQPRDSFYALWSASNDFLNAAKKDKQPILRFIDLLSKKPFKLKQGFIDFWVPTFLFLKRDDFALYSDNVFIPSISDETLELIAKKPKDFTIKSFDIEGVRLDIFNSYRVFLQQETKSKFGNESFIETIKPFLVFYKTLPEYAKKTVRLSKPALAIRDAIAKSKDPEHTFFEAFPAALGTSIKDLNEDSSLLAKYTETLQESIREVRTCFDSLVERFEAFIKHDILFEEQHLSFEDWKLKLQSRYANLKRHLLLQKQKTFVQRIDSQLDEKKAWLSSICQALMSKNLEAIGDEDELVLHESFKNMVSDLDGLMELSCIEIDESKEEVFNLQLATFGASSFKSVIRVSKLEADRLNEYTQKLEQELTADKEINKLILTKLLQKLLLNE
jgi:hypothetical protein